MIVTGDVAGRDLSETVSRTLTRLKRSGIIILESDRKIALADHVALEEMAEGF